MSPTGTFQSPTIAREPTYSISICSAERTSRTGVFPIAIPPTTIFTANASSIFDHQENGVSIWIMFGPHRAWLFQTIRGCQWQSWVSQVDDVGLDAYIEEDAAIYLTPPDVFPFDSYRAVDHESCDSDSESDGTTVGSPSLPYDPSRITYTINILRSQEGQIYHEALIPIENPLEDLLACNTYYIFDGQDSISIWIRSQPDASPHHCQCIRRRSKMDLAWINEVDWPALNSKINEGVVISLTPPYVFPFEA
ncbi:hypothetical protein SCLCIDRAFT_29737 [Scleroderma citrinum Foug A]|uniref:Uncharacterized protein n=1 Tax=Scleroderma citrinum Foug A TaxID=1036808 RepID=A0A0C3DJP7_9AGAM|nr:hypothetical protein SCLCIDRAFT_29737 [Scleroderma citrinum Foug A]